jgi:hypothetical protein
VNDAEAHVADACIVIVFTFLQCTNSTVGAQSCACSVTQKKLAFCGCSSNLKDDVGSRHSEWLLPLPCKWGMNLSVLIVFSTMPRDRPFLVQWFWNIFWRGLIIKQTTQISVISVASHPKRERSTKEVQ